MVLQYDANSGVLLVALTLRHTVLPDVLMSCEFWVFLGIHLSIYIASRAGYLDLIDPEAVKQIGLDFNIVKISTGIATFFEVFYANQCYSRYMTMYKTTKQVFVDACGHVLVLKLYLSSAPGHLRLSCRYVLLCLVVHFLHIRQDNVSIDNLTDLVAAGLLRQSEKDALMCRPSSHWSTVVLGWSNDVAAIGCDKVKDVNPMAHRASHNLTRTLLQIHSNLLRIQDLLTLPVPFQYFHLLCLMVVGTIMLWAYAFGVTESFFSPIAFVLCTVIFLSTMRLSSALADPFGDDEVDFPMQKWLYECAEKMEDIMRSDFVDGREAMEQLAQAEAAQSRFGRSLGSSIAQSRIGARCPIPENLAMHPDVQLERLDNSGGGLRRERTDTSVTSHASEALELLGGCTSARGKSPPVSGRRSPSPKYATPPFEPEQWPFTRLATLPADHMNKGSPRGSPRSCERVCGPADHIKEDSPRRSPRSCERVCGSC